MEVSFSKVISSLETYYGRPKPPALAEGLHLIIWESIGYLVEDDRRAIAFEALRQQVGLKPTDLLAAPIEQLIGITRLGGIHPEMRAQRLKEIAHIVLNDFDGDLSIALREPIRKAIKALQKFPSIGEPGAEKILLFTKTHPVLALESNGLRVLLRLGFGEEHRNYSTSYRSVQEALADQTGDDCDFLIRAHQLLRQHGKETCKTNNPSCKSCPLRTQCRYFAAIYRQ